MWICLAEFTDPRALPCLHVYCRECLDASMARSQDPKVVSCPVCRKQTNVPDCGSAEGFPSYKRIRDGETKLPVSRTCRCSGCQSVQMTVIDICDTCGPIGSDCAVKETAAKSSHKVRLNYRLQRKIELYVMVSLGHLQKNYNYCVIRFIFKPNVHDCF